MASNASLPDEDPYQTLCRGLTPGLLITVNNSDPTALSFGEMEVQFVDDDGDVNLTGHDGTQYLLTHNTTNEGPPVIKEMSETEFSPLREEVITIEIVGING